MRYCWSRGGTRNGNGNEVARLREENEKLTEHVRQLTETIEECEFEAGKLQASVATVSDASQSLAFDVFRVEESTANLRAGNEGLGVEILRFEGEHSMFKQTVQNIENVNAKLTENLVQLGCTRREQEAEAALDGQVQKLDGELVQLETIRRGLDASITGFVDLAKGIDSATQKTGADFAILQSHAHRIYHGFARISESIDANARQMSHLMSVQASIALAREIDMAKRSIETYTDRQSAPLKGIDEEDWKLLIKRFPKPVKKMLWHSAGMDSGDGVDDDELAFHYFEKHGGRQTGRLGEAEIDYMFESISGLLSIWVTPLPLSMRCNIGSA